MNNSEQSIEQLLALTTPIQIVTIDAYREGSVEVVLRDASGQTLVLMFEHGDSMYLCPKESSNPATYVRLLRGSQVEYDALSLMKNLLDEYPAHQYSDKLREKIEQTEERRKLAIFGIIAQ